MRILPTYDVIIIGAGPSGAHCAKLLGQNKDLKVLLVDARSFSENEKHHKACGGLLSSHAQEELHKENMSIPDSIKRDPQLSSVSTFDLSARLHRFYPRSYVNIDRQAFERWLISLIPPNVRCEFETRVLKITKEGSLYEINLTQAHEEFCVSAKLCIGADGADSIVRRTFFNDRPFPKRYVSIQERYPCLNKHSAFFGFFDESITDYYSWALQKENELLIGSALEIDGQVHQKFDRLKSKVKEVTDFDLDKLILTEGAIINRPVSLNQLSFHKGCVALIGEASGSISPTSAEGFSFAFRSARYLSTRINQDGPTYKACEHYDKDCNNIRLTILLKLLKAPGMYWPWLRRIVMISKISSINPNKSGLIKKRRAH
ncbi:MAG: FAD-binding protein [Erysipelotrichaceae bacterium]|nr:FAD-binding protein [Erysipelotrichaceae bacterium]